MSSPLRLAFGPGDVTCVAVLPGASFVLEEVTDFSVSSHRDKYAIRRLGHDRPVGFSYGTTTTAGTLLCAQIPEGALWKLRRHIGGIQYVARGGQANTVRSLDVAGARVLPQDLPPIHLLFVYQSERGLMAVARLYGVVFSDTGATQGASSPQFEEALHFQALDYEQVRLSKSASVAQLQTLAEKPVGFFNDLERVEPLVDQVAALSLAGQSAYGELDPTYGDDRTYVLWSREGAQPRAEVGADPTLVADDTLSNAATPADPTVITLPRGTPLAPIAQPMNLVPLIEERGTDRYVRFTETGLFVGPLTPNVWSSVSGGSLAQALGIPNGLRPTTAQVRVTSNGEIAIRGMYEPTTTPTTEVVSLWRGGRIDIDGSLTGTVLGVAGTFDGWTTIAGPLQAKAVDDGDTARVLFRLDRVNIA